MSERVIKEGGDYRFEGEIVSTFRKKSGAIRVVVENDDGILHIFNPSQLKTVGDEPKDAPGDKFGRAAAEYFRLAKELEAKRGIVDPQNNDMKGSE